MKKLLSKKFREREDKIKRKFAGKKAEEEIKISISVY